LRMVPRGKTVVLGLVTTKEPRLESQDELRRRIDDAAKYVPLENLALSPQCGFASVASGNLLSMDEQWRKLELVVDTARKVWGECLVGTGRHWIKNTRAKFYKIAPLPSGHQDIG
jgi:5-methyltetrahydropteroyltriglutamate--homocysteine methyltransferase